MTQVSIDVTVTILISEEYHSELAVKQLTNNTIPQYLAHQE